MLLDIVKTKFVSIQNPIPCSALMNIRNPTDSFTKSKRDCATKIKKGNNEQQFHINFLDNYTWKSSVISDAVIKVEVMMPAIAGLSLIVATKIGKPAVIM